MSVLEDCGSSLGIEGDLDDSFTLLSCFIMFLGKRWKLFRGTLLSRFIMFSWEHVRSSIEGKANLEDVFTFLSCFVILPWEDSGCSLDHPMKLIHVGVGVSSIFRVLRE